MKKFLSTLLIILISLPLILPVSVVQAAISPQIADFLCEKGIFYYDHGKYPQALVEFKKALLANPESRRAKEFIQRIEGQEIAPQVMSSEALFNEKGSVVDLFLDRLQIKESVPPAIPSQTMPAQEMNELQKAVISSKQRGQVSGEVRAPAPKLRLLQSQVAPEETVIDINQESAGKEVTDIETNIAERLILKGENILRFVVTQPDLLKVTRLSADELLVEPQDLTSTYMHIWDNKGRKTFRFAIGPRKFEEESLEAMLEKVREANLPQSFRLSYGIDGDSFMTGRGFGDLKRQSQVWSYNASAVGETPYGYFDSAVQGSRTTLEKYRISSLTMGLTGGHYDQLKDISIRAFDFTPAISAFGFPGSTLRGIMANAPMFHHQLDYTTFWGAIPAGDFTQLAISSGLAPTKKAWLEGVGLNYRLGSVANFRSFYAHSYGPERSEPVLTSDTSGFGMLYNFGRFDIGSDMVYDHIKNISYAAHSNINFSKVHMGLSFSDYNKHFASLLGGPALSGSTNGAMTINYRPTPDINIVDSFTATIDKVFGNPLLPGRPNYNSLTKFYWTLDPHTELELGYNYDDRIGSNSPEKTETIDFGIRKKFFFLRKLNTYFNYQNRKNESLSSPAQDFNNNRILAGLSFRVLGELFAYYNREFNFLRNTFSGDTAFPMAQEVGLNFYRQIFDSPFYTNSRIYYRVEENTESQLSFLSGQDRLEGESELTYKPNPDSETYIKVRITNVWAAKQGADKHLDLDLSWGMRFLWDTGFRWPSVGSFYGYVFYDLNADGVKEVGERGIKGVQIKGPEGKTYTTSAMGYYKVPRVSGRQATLEIDLKTIPKGYSPTTSTVREVDVVHATAKRVDFGIITRSEISGIVFSDKNENGKYDPGEEPLRGVAIILDDKQKTVTTPLGEYMFRKLSPGDHTLTLDLKSVPLKFIPKVPLTKKVKVMEGTTFVYNIPLQETKETPPEK